MIDLDLDNAGLRLAASVAGPVGAPPVVLLHGLSMSRDTWQPLAMALADRHRVWTLDFRGHGHSARAARYDFADYLSDALCLLRLIDQAPVVIGHSLGGAVAGALAQQPGRVRGALLEDPPWFLGDACEATRSGFPRLFEVTGLLQARLLRDQSPLEDYVAFMGNAPGADGRTAGTQISERHLWSRASALQRLDPRCLRPVAESLQGLEPDRAFEAPVRVVRADPALGAAFAPHHEARLLAHQLRASVTMYPGAGHVAHIQDRFAERFEAEVDAFIGRCLVD